MRHQLINIDIDGTLLNNAGKISPLTSHVIQQLTRRGHHVILTTGRPDNISTNYYDQLGLHSPMINFNGALIHRPHQQWSAEQSQTMSKSDALALIDLPQRYPVSLLVAEGKNFTLPNHAYTGMPFLADMPQPKHLFNVQGLNRPPISVTAFVKESQLTALQAIIKTDFPQLTGRLWGAWSGEDTALEIVRGQVSKSQAIAYLLAYYQKTTADVWAFGDASNDLDMLKFAGHGIAMQNADPVVKQAADQVTRFDNEQDGLARFLQQTFLSE